MMGICFNKKLLINYFATCALTNNDQAIFQQAQHEGLINAAVLVTIIEHNDHLGLLLTKRPENMKSHPGQISFPGGKVDEADKTLVDTALRETKEEVGLAANSISILGQLDNLPTRTGFLITPIVAIIPASAPITPHPSEVSEVFEVPFHFVMEPENHQQIERNFSGRWLQSYKICYNDYYIWGATAQIIVDLSEKLRRASF